MTGIVSLHKQHRQNSQQTRLPTDNKSAPPTLLQALPAHQGVGEGQRDGSDCVLVNVQGDLVDAFQWGDPDAQRTPALTHTQTTHIYCKADLLREGFEDSFTEERFTFKPLLIQMLAHKRMVTHTEQHCSPSLPLVLAG